jgi:hypothetical protein
MEHMHLLVMAILTDRLLFLRILTSMRIFATCRNSSTYHVQKGSLRSTDWLGNFVSIEVKKNNINNF